MKSITLIVAGLLVGATTVSASVKLIRGEAWGQVGIGSDATTVFKVSDHTTGATCYVLKSTQGPAHAVSCVK